MSAYACIACGHALHAGRVCCANVSGKLGHSKVECECDGRGTQPAFSEASRQRRQDLINAAQSRADELDHLDHLKAAVALLSTADRVELFRPYHSCGMKKNEGGYCPSCED